MEAGPETANGSVWYRIPGRICVPLLLCSMLCLQTGRRALAQTYSFQAFGQEQGLTDLGVTAIAAAADGRFWVGTQYGLFRFDGARFLHIPSVEPNAFPFISALYVDEQDRLWFTDTQSIYFRDKSGVHRIAGSDLNMGYGTPPQIAALPGNPETIYFTGDGRLRRVISGDGGRNWHVEEVFSPSQKAALPELNNVRSLVVREGRDLWMGCGQSICEYAKGRVRLWSEKEGIPAAAWNSLLADHNGSLWARGAGHVRVLEAGSSVFRSEEAGLPSQALDAGTVSLVEDRRGRVITGIANGIALHDRAGWHTITSRNGFPAEIVSTLFISPQGTLWMGVTGRGLVRWLGSMNWEGWTANDGLTTNNVWAIARDRRGWVWAGTENSLEVLKPGMNRFQPVRAASGRTLTHVLTILATPDGRIWTTTREGSLIAYDPETGHSVTVANLKGIYHLFTGAKGRIWICSGEGIWFVDSAGTRLKAISAGGPAGHQQVFDGGEDRSGVLWFVGNDKLIRSDGRLWTELRLPDELHIPIFGQIAVAPDGTLWVTTVGHGAVHLRQNGPQLQRISEPAESQSASPNVVLLHLDDRGWLWAGTDSGVDVYNGRRWVHISHQDGLVWDDTDSNAFFSDRDGSLWIGTSGGIGHLLDPRAIFREAPMHVELNRVRLGNKLLPADGSGIFPWQKQPLILRLSVSDLSRTHAVEYHYRLAGLENDWTHTPEPNVRYASLPPGSYRLEAFALDLDRNFQTPVVGLSFRILEPWWRRPWFYVVLLLAIAGWVTLFWRWRHRVLLQRQRYLEELVEARTRELAELAIHDSLTGLLNRAAIFELLDKEIDRAHRGDGLLAVVLADLDHFKEVNDRFGHQTGDAVLTAFCRRMRTFLRAYDGLGRYGGEEFLIVIPGIGREELLTRMEGLRTSVAAQPFEANQRNLSITCSFGVTMLRAEDRSSAGLIARADAALYAAKRGGRNRVIVQEMLEDSPVR